MGQGTYTAFLWGCPDIESANDNIGDKVWEKLYDKAMDLGISQAYECDVRYCGIRLLADQGMGGEELCKHAEHFSVALNRLSEYVEEEVGKTKLDKAKKKWEQFRDIGRTLGVSVPAGQFVIVNDYD